MNLQLLNARIFGKPKTELFDLKISDGQIVSIYPAGVDRESKAQMDVQGGWVAPGFIDSHVHTTNTGVQLLGLNLTGCDSYDALQRSLREINKSENIVLGHGWDDSKWQKTANIEAFPANAPMTYLSRIDAHSALVSPSLLNEVLKIHPELEKASGFSRAKPLVADAHGIVREFAYANLSDKRRSEYIEKALQSFLEVGIYEVNEMAGPRISSFHDAEMVLNRAIEKKISVKMWWGELEGHKRALDLNAIGCGGDLFIDGSFGSKTALVNEPYADGTLGRQYISLEDATQHILTGYDYELSTSFHAIGDAAIEVAVQAFENAKKTIGDKSFTRLKHRIEHAELLSDSQINRLIGLGVFFSMQPQFSSYWAGENGMYQQRIGDRWMALNPFREILKNGGRLLFGSDSPVTNVNPWDSIAAATQMHNEEHSITYRAAFRAHTQGDSANSSEVAIGSPANLAVWDVTDWHQLQIDEVRNRWSTDARSFPVDYPDASKPPTCLMTVSNGEVAYSSIGSFSE